MLSIGGEIDIGDAADVDASIGVESCVEDGKDGIDMYESDEQEESLDALEGKGDCEIVGPFGPSETQKVLAPLFDPDIWSMNRSSQRILVCDCVTFHALF